MDYETILVEDEFRGPSKPCYLDHDMDLGWERGELTEIRLTLRGNFIVNDDTVITIDDFLYDSSTKFIYMVLKDFNDEIVDEQIAYMEDLEYGPESIAAYFHVDQELTDKARPGSYHLFVFLRNVVPNPSNNKGTNLLNVLLTDSDGIEILVT